MKVRITIILMTLCLSIGFALTSASSAANDGATVSAVTTGVLQICKAASGSGLANRIFKFKIGTLIVEVPVGQCSAPITIPAGSYLIEELLDGRISPRGTFTGGFQLIGVRALGTTPASAVGGVDLPSRTAKVYVAAGDAQKNPTIIGFTKSPAPTPGSGGTGALEICKAVFGSGLENRIFKFKIGELTWEVVAGQCSGPITVPAGVNVVEELLDGRTTTGGTFSGGFQLTGVSALGATPPSAITGVNLSLRTANVNVSEGGVQNATRIQFTNSPANTLPPVNFTTATLAGLNIRLEPTGSLNLIFGNVLAAGNTSVTILSPEQTQPLPAEFSSADVLRYEITTSAAFSGGVTVSFKVPNVENAATCDLYRILQYTYNILGEPGSTASAYNGENHTCTVSQTVASLSSFVVARLTDSDNDASNLRGRIQNVGGSLNFFTASRIGTTPAVVLNNTGTTLMTVNGSVKTGTLTFNPFFSGQLSICVVSSSDFSLAQCSSSLRYKTDLQPFTGGMNVIDRLQPITYKWKSDGTPDLGFGAEPVSEIEPLLVSHNQNGEVEGVKYDRLSTVFVNALKEQQAEIEAQKAEIKQQREEIEALKTLVCAANREAKICKEKQ